MTPRTARRPGRRSSSSAADARRSRSAGTGPRASGSRAGGVGVARAPGGRDPIAGGGAALDLPGTVGTGRGDRPAFRPPRTLPADPDGRGGAHDALRRWPAAQPGHRRRARGLRAELQRAARAAERGTRTAEAVHGRGVAPAPDSARRPDRRDRRRTPATAVRRRPRANPGPAARRRGPTLAGRRGTVVPRAGRRRGRAPRPGAGRPGRLGGRARSRLVGPRTGGRPAIRAGRQRAFADAGAPAAAGPVARQPAGERLQVQRGGHADPRPRRVRAGLGHARRGRRRLRHPARRPGACFRAILSRRVGPPAGNAGGRAGAVRRAPDRRDARRHDHRGKRGRRRQPLRGPAAPAPMPVMAPVG